MNELEQNAKYVEEAKTRVVDYPVGSIISVSGTEDNSWYRVTGSYNESRGIVPVVQIATEKSDALSAFTTVKFLSNGDIQRSGIANPMDTINENEWKINQERLAQKEDIEEKNNIITEGKMISPSILYGLPPRRIINEPEPAIIKDNQKNIQELLTLSPQEPLLLSPETISPTRQQTSSSTEFEQFSSIAKNIPNSKYEKSLVEAPKLTKEQQIAPESYNVEEELKQQIAKGQFRNPTIQEPINLEPIFKSLGTNINLGITGLATGIFKTGESLGNKLAENPLTFPVHTLSTTLQTGAGIAVGMANLPLSTIESIGQKGVIATIGESIPSILVFKAVGEGLTSPITKGKTSGIAIGESETLKIGEDKSLTGKKLDILLEEGTGKFTYEHPKTIIDIVKEKIFLPEDFKPKVTNVEFKYEAISKEPSRELFEKSHSDIQKFGKDYTKFTEEGKFRESLPKLLRGEEILEASGKEMIKTDVTLNPEAKFPSKATLYEAKAELPLTNLENKNKPSLESSLSSKGVSEASTQLVGKTSEKSVFISLAKQKELEMIKRTEVLEPKDYYIPRSYRDASPILLQREKPSGNINIDLISKKLKDERSIPKFSSNIEIPSEFFEAKRPIVQTKIEEFRKFNRRFEKLRELEQFEIINKNIKQKGLEDFGMQIVTIEKLPKKQYKPEYEAKLKDTILDSAIDVRTLGHQENKFMELLKPKESRELIPEYKKTIKEKPSENIGNSNQVTILKEPKTKAKELTKLKLLSGMPIPEPRKLELAESSLFRQRTIIKNILPNIEKPKSFNKNLILVKNNQILQTPQIQDLQLAPFQIETQKKGIIQTQKKGIRQNVIEKISHIQIPKVKQDILSYNKQTQKQITRQTQKQITRQEQIINPIAITKTKSSFSISFSIPRLTITPTDITTPKNESKKAKKPSIILNKRISRSFAKNPKLRISAGIISAGISVLRFGKQTSPSVSPKVLSKASIFIPTKEILRNPRYRRFRFL